jgi:hypothetical protein
VIVIQQFTDIQAYIDSCIKHIWLNHISRDYIHKHLLLEDSLKNAFYHHLRSEIGDQYMQDNNIRIFTEFKLGIERADIALVQIDPSCDGHLYEHVLEVLAIIELKYKNGTSDTPFQNDVRKVLNYIKRDSGKCQYYLAFIQEVIVYEPLEDFSWLTKKQVSQTESRLTEMTSISHPQSEKPSWSIRSYNNFPNHNDQS